jgi:hypothetical protein
MSRRPVVVLALLASVATAACGRGTITQEPIAPRATDSIPTQRLRVMLPPAGAQGEPASRLVAARVVMVLQQTHADVALIPSADKAEAIIAAREAKADFLVQPIVVTWVEGHAPPFTADHISIRLELIHPKDGAVLNAVVFDNTSSLWAVSDESPDALLDRTFDRAVILLLSPALGA